MYSVISDAYAGGGGSFNDPTMSPGYATNGIILIRLLFIEILIFFCFFLKKKLKGYAGSAYPSVMGGTGDIPNGYANEKSPY